MKNKCILFLSIFVGILTLAACSNEKDKVIDDKVVYIPEIISVTSKMKVLDDWCVSGGDGYMLCREQNQGDSPHVVQRILADGSGIETLLEYWAAKPSLDVPASGFNYSGSFCALQAGSDGTLWESAGLNIYGSDAEGYWEDFVPVLRHLDKEGKELSRVDFDADLAEDPRLGHLRKFIVDGEGTVYADYERGIAMLDDGENIVFSLTPDGYDRLTVNSIVILGDGRVGILFSEHRITEDDDLHILRTIDKETQELVNSFRLNGSGLISVFSGDGDVLFYYTINDTLCAWQKDSEEGAQILNLMEVGVNSSYLRAVAGQSDGEIVLFTQEPANYGPDGIQMVRLTPTVATKSEKKVLTLATTHMWTNLQEKILEFNRNNQEYHISVTDYSQYGGYNEAMTRLATEIIAGNVPDLLATYQMSVTQWAARGVLEDLWPYIDNDMELERDGLMVRVLEAAEIDGKLYEIGSGFQISTLVGAKNVVGDRMTWAIEDVMDALKTMPDGCILFSYRDKTELLTSLIDWSRFVDWKDGICRFDSKEFRTLIEICGNMPENTAQSGYTINRNLLDQRQMLMRTSVTGFTFPARAEMLLGGEISYIGYPNTYGEVGSSFVLAENVAMCSACHDKDGAWAFLRMMLLPQGEDGVSLNSFPINKADFESMAENAMELDYLMDKEGNYLLDENDEKIPNSSLMVQIDDSLSMEINSLLTQTEYDKIISLYNAIDSFNYVDSDLSTIVIEETGAYFAGDRALDKTMELIQNRASLYMNEQSK